MKKQLFLTITILVSIGLAACGNENPIKDYQIGNDPTTQEESNLQNENDSHESQDPVEGNKIGENEQPNIPTEKEDDQTTTEVEDGQPNHEPQTSPETSTDQSNENNDQSEKKKDYEIVQEKANGKFPLAFVTVASEDSEQLKLIAQELKINYPKNKVIGVNILFFTEDKHQEAINQNDDHAFAKFTVNYKGNVSKLIFFNDQKPIHIQ